MGCNAHNHPPGCDCGFGGDTGGGFFSSNFWGSGDVPMPQNVVRQVTFNTTCPLCGEPCYYYENEFGSKVWFDELGVPWTKHPCFVSETRLQSNRPKQATDALIRLLDLEPNVRRVFSKRLWQTRNWQFFAVLKDKQDMPYVYPWERRKANAIDVQDHERAIGYFFARHTIENGPFSLMSWRDETYFALPSVGEAFPIFPTIWRDAAFDNVGPQRVQRTRECFRAVLEDAASIKDPQDRIHLAELLYDQTDLPIETIAFLARVSLMDAIDISNGDAKPAYVKNFGKVRRVAESISDRLLRKQKRN